MPVEGLCLEITHTGLSQGSVHISDVTDGVDALASFRKAGPIYVPYLGTVRVSYTSTVQISFEVGGIRKFMEGGYLTAEFIIGDTLAGVFPTILDEGIVLTPTPASIDFIGAGVTATIVGDAVAVTITGGGVGGGDMFIATYDPTAVSGDAFDSSNHAYDNTASGLAAGNTQAALDEIDGRVDVNDAKVSAVGNYRLINATAPVVLADAPGVIALDASGGSLAATLFTAIGNSGKCIVFKRIDDTPANNANIQTVLSQLIDGLTSTTLQHQFESIEVFSDGANWLIIG